MRRKFARCGYRNRFLQVCSPSLITIPANNSDSGVTALNVSTVMEFTEVVLLAGFLYRACVGSFRFPIGILLTVSTT